MRTAFINKLIELARNDKNIYLITSDTGFSILEEFEKLFSEQYLNIGISEANMIGVASGLSLGGKKVFLYAIAPFITMRCFEQVRIDLCYQNIPVKLIGVGAGLTYGNAGATHHSIEDIAVMNCLPNMTVICPGDPIEVGKAVEESLKLNGPCYIRIGKSGEPNIHKEVPGSFSLGKGIRLRIGENVALVATGNMLETAIKVYEILKEKNIDTEVISMHTVKPIDKEMIIETSKRCKFIATMEEHNVIGGLGSRVADVITEENLNVRLKKFAIPDKYVDVVGDQDYLRNYYGLTAEQISEKILSLIE